MKAKTSNLYYHEKIIDIGSICEVIKKLLFLYILCIHIFTFKQGTRLSGTGSGRSTGANRNLV